MKSISHQTEKYIQAKKRVKGIRGFYSHLVVFITVNVILFILKIRVFGFLRDNGVDDPNFMDWLDWNIISTPSIWSVALIVHGIHVHRFKFRFIRKWEERQLRKLMEKDQIPPKTTKS